MIYRLVILNGERKGQQVTIPRDPLTIGRGDDCSLQLTDPEMASVHAAAQHGREGPRIRDMGSMGRILLNNDPVREARLVHGDVVDIGRTRFLVQAVVEAEVHDAGAPREGQPMRALALVVVGVTAGAVLFLWTRQDERRPGEADLAAPREEPQAGGRGVG